MKFTKIIAAVFAAALTAVCSAAFTAFAASAQASEKDPVYADSLVPGQYEIQVTSSSSMFRIVKCELTVSGSDMTAEMTLSGKGYEKLFPGTAEQAENADEARFCFFHEDAEGKYAYTFPVGALDQQTDCAAYSFKKQRWYERTLIFESDSLPDEAFVPAEQETTDGVPEAIDARKEQFGTDRLTEALNSGKAETPQDATFTGFLTAQRSQDVLCRLFTRGRV